MRDDCNYFCELCSAACGNDTNWTSHINGAGHKKKERQALLLRPVSEPLKRNFFSSDFDEAENEPDYEPLVSNTSSSSLVSSTLPIIHPTSASMCPTTMAAVALLSQSNYSSRVTTCQPSASSQPRLQLRAPAIVQPNSSDVQRTAQPIGPSGIQPIRPQPRPSSRFKETPVRRAQPETISIPSVASKGQPVATPNAQPTSIIIPSALTPTSKSVIIPSATSSLAPSVASSLAPRRWEVAMSSRIVEDRPVLPPSSHVRPFPSAWFPSTSSVSPSASTVSPSAVPARLSVPARPSVVPSSPSFVPARSSVVAARSSAIPARSSVVPVRPCVVPARPSALPVRSVIRPQKRPSPPQNVCGNGFLRAAKSIYHQPRVYVCDLCSSRIDSRWNLIQHRNSAKCRALQPDSPIPSPATDSEPYIIRRRPARAGSPVSERSVSPVSSVVGSRRSRPALPLDSPVRLGSPAQLFSRESSFSVVSQSQSDLSLPPSPDLFSPLHQSQISTCLPSVHQSQISTCLPSVVSSSPHSSLEGSEPPSPLPITSTLELPSESLPCNQFRCGNCDIEFLTLYELRAHRRRCHPDSMRAILDVCRDFRSPMCSMHAGQQAFRGMFRSVIVRPTNRCLTADQLMESVSEGLRRALEHCLDYGDNIKVMGSVKILMHKIDISTGDVVDRDFTYTSTKARPIQSRADIDDFFAYVHKKVEEHIEKFTSKGSNWIVGGINEVMLKLVKYRLYRGGAGRLVLPARLANKKCCLNIESTDEECFKIAVVASLHHSEIQDQHNKSRRANFEPFFRQYDFTNLKFPAGIVDIEKFQDNNKNVCVNALLYNHQEKLDGKRVTPLYHPPRRIAKDRKIAHILLVKDHWLPITDLNRLITTRTEEGVRDQTNLCYRCMRNCYKPDRLNKHLEKCYERLGQKEVMPDADKAKKEFDEWSKMLSPPFVLYGDIEAVLETPDDNDNDKILQTHCPCAVGSYLVPHKALDTYPRSKVVKHVGLDCVEQFCNYLEDKCRHIYDYNKIHCNKKQDRSDPIQVRKFEETTSCQFCKVPFSEQTMKVWHHDHISGEFIAAVCQRCNTRIRQPLATLPVFFHNLRNYDMHALCIQGFSKKPNWHLKPIAQTKEKYLTVTAHFEIDKREDGRPIYFTLRFIDSFQFMSASLDNLVKSMDRTSMQHVRNCHNFNTLDEDVIYGKGVFPYSYLDSMEKLDATELPAKDAFFDMLTNSVEISDLDYVRAQRAWNGFRCTTFKDYMLHYLELDVLLLADVFENFRSEINDLYQLDAANFITLPQMSFAAAFRSCKVDLLIDVEMYEFFEEGIRGGMTFVNKHHVEADDQTAIAYWDENNLYGGALRQLLPCGEFRWVEPKDFEKIDWLNIETEGDTGYALKVDLEYPPEIHDETQDFPLAPEPECVTREMFTPLMERQWRERCELRNVSNKFVPCKKLLMTCRDKKEYVVHYKLLKFYLKMGLRISKIHSVIRFKQEPIFREYIDKNSERRQNASSEFKKDLYKLLNNALFGKTMENVRGRKDFALSNSEEKFEALASKPQFLTCHHFSEQLILSEQLKLEVRLDRPIFIGQAVLDLSKLTMFQLRYEQLRTYEGEFQGRICVLGGDTDSLICSVHNIDLQQLHRSMLRDKLLDTSNYPRVNPLWTNDFKAKLGCIKDEVEGDTIVDAVLLKPKCYSLLTNRPETCKKTAKGVQKCVRKAITHQEFKDVYLLNTQLTKNVRRFQSKDHTVYTIQQRKWALSVVDDKRAWISENESLPFGHYRLTTEEGPSATKRPRIE